MREAVSRRTKPNVMHGPPTLNSRTVFTLYPPGPDDCRHRPAMTFRRARSASRFTVAQLNFGRESLRDALKRDTKLWPSEPMPVKVVLGRCAASATLGVNRHNVWRCPPRTHELVALNSDGAVATTLRIKGYRTLRRDLYLRGLAGRAPVAQSMRISSWVHGGGKRRKGIRSRRGEFHLNLFAA
jgi:hypothetical protein